MNEIYYQVFYFWITVGVVIALVGGLTFLGVFSKRKYRPGAMLVSIIGILIILAMLIKHAIKLNLI